MKTERLVCCKKLTIAFPKTGASRSFLGLRKRPEGHFEKNYQPVLKKVDFELNRGDSVAILGHNGAGKSTFLRCLSGVYKPTKGTLEVKGSVTPLFSVAVGTDIEASGYENIPLLMASRGIPLNLLKDVTKDVEEFTEMGDALYRPLKTYSAGMKLRIAFAVATFEVSDILLMDEVIGTGDKEFREKSRSRIQGLMKQAETLVLASHSDPVLKEFCSRGLVFKRGELIFDGDIDGAIAARQSS